jgi:hypothetical protein
MKTAVKTVETLAHLRLRVVTYKFCLRVSNLRDLEFAKLSLVNLRSGHSACTHCAQ